MRARQPFRHHPPVRDKSSYPLLLQSSGPPTSSPLRCGKSSFPPPPSPPSPTNHAAPLAIFHAPPSLTTNMSCPLGHRHLLSQKRTSAACQIRPPYRFPLLDRVREHSPPRTARNLPSMSPLLLRALMASRQNCASPTPSLARSRLGYSIFDSSSGGTAKSGSMALF